MVIEMQRAVLALYGRSCPLYGMIARKRFQCSFKSMYHQSQSFVQLTNWDKFSLVNIPTMAIPTTKREDNTLDKIKLKPLRYPNGSGNIKTFTPESL